jgi:hypothetical protein
MNVRFNQRQRDHYFRARTPGFRYWTMGFSLAIVCMKRFARISTSLSCLRVISFGWSGLREALSLNCPGVAKRRFNEVRRVCGCRRSVIRIPHSHHGNSGRRGRRAGSESCRSPNVIVIVTPLKELPQSTYETGVEVMISSYQRTATWPMRRPGI